jgi:hypothetical protein
MSPTEKFGIASLALLVLIGLLLKFSQNSDH